MQNNKQLFKQGSKPIAKKPFSLYFLKTNDKKQLSPQQQKEILNFIQTQGLIESSLVYNSFETKRKYQKWTKTLPWIKVHYAVKANSSLPILNDLIEEGSNFDCASLTEMQALLGLGVSSKSIVYSNPIKEQTDLAWAYVNGIQLTVADTIDELYKIKEHAPNMKILWRIAVKEEQYELNDYFCNKFGDDLQNDKEIHKRMKQIMQMGVNLMGIHFHYGSCLNKASTHQKAILNARRCLEIGREYGHKMQIMDIGGGFPSGQLPQSTIRVLKITQNDPLGYKVFAEPGRHFCQCSFYLLTRVIGKRQKNKRTCFHVNESIFHCFNNDIREFLHFQFYSQIDSDSLTVSKIQQRIPSTIFGMTCDGIDVLYQNIPVPSQIKIGDWLLFSNMGAYVQGLKTEFNGMKSCGKIIKWSAQIHQDSNNLGRTGQV